MGGGVGCVNAEDHSYVCGSGNGSFLLGGVPGRGMEGMQQHLFLVLLTCVPDSDFAIDVFGNESGGGVFLH